MKPGSQGFIIIDIMLDSGFRLCRWPSHTPSRFITSTNSQNKTASGYQIEGQITRSSRMEHITNPGANTSGRARRRWSIDIFSVAKTEDIVGTTPKNKGKGHSKGVHKIWWLQRSWIYGVDDPFPAAQRILGGSSIWAICMPAIHICDVHTVSRMSIY